MPSRTVKTPILKSPAARSPAAPRASARGLRPRAPSLAAVATFATAPPATVMPLPAVVAVDAENVTLGQAVYARIKDDIFDFRMAPGQRYAEQELANRFGVSRTPLRFALHVLAREGYLDRVGGHAGWLVKPFDLAYYEDLYDFRTEIELIAVRRLCAMDPAPDLRELCAFWRVPRKARETDGLVVAREDEKLHSTLVALAGNAEMLRTHTDLTERIRIIRRLDFIEPARIKAAFDEHDKILGALLARRGVEAELFIKAHIGTSRAEIRHITLHRLAMAAEQGARATVSSGA